MLSLSLYQKSTVVSSLQSGDDAPSKKPLEIPSLGCQGNAEETSLSLSKKPSKKTLTPTAVLLGIQKKAGVITEANGKQTVFFLALKDKPAGYGLDNVSNIPTIKLDVMPRSQRKLINKLARDKGLKPHGWNFELKENATGDLSLQAERMYGTLVKGAKLPGTSLQVEYVTSVIYEVLEDGAKADESIPDAVATAGVKVAVADSPDRIEIQPAGNVSGVSAPKEVRTFLLPGGGIKLTMPAPVNENDPVQDNEQTVLLHMHGFNLPPDALDAFVPQLNDVHIDIYGPSSKILLVENMHQCAEKRLYGSLYQENGLSIAESMAPSAQKAQNVEDLAGTEIPLQFRNIKFTKYGGEIDGATTVESGGQMQTHISGLVIDDKEDKRAVDFMVHRSKMHVLSLRKNHECTLEQAFKLIKKLAQEGLTYKRIGLVACRGEVGLSLEERANALYAMSDNPTAKEVKTKSPSLKKLVGKNGELIPDTVENRIRLRFETNFLQADKDASYTLNDAFSWSDLTTFVPPPEDQAD